MTDFRDQDREAGKIEGDERSPLSRRLQDLKGKMMHGAAGVGRAFSRIGKKRALITCGTLVLLAAAGFGGHSYVQANTVEYVELYRDGVLIGTVDAKETIDSFLDREKAALSEAHPGINMQLETGELTYVERSAYKAKPETEATVGKLDEMLTSHAVGVEVRVNGKLIGVVKDRSTANDVLKRVQTTLVPEVAEAEKPEVTALAVTRTSASADVPAIAEPKSSIETVRFVEQVDTDAIRIDPSRISDADTLVERLVTGKTKQTTYVVQEGDCIGCIAQRFGISPQLIYQNNPQIEGELIRVGDELDLTVLQPGLTVETIENVTEIEEIAPEIIVQKNDEMRVSQQKTIRQGVPGSKRVTYRLVKQNGYLMSEELLDEQVITPAVPAIVMKGTKVVLGEGTGKFSWPVSGARLTSSYGKRWGRLHKGIDLIGKKSILAADHGVVEFAGTKNGMGKTVILDHKNGFKTVYGHLSKISVKKGEVVEKGDTLGIMGNTGNSTGTHLHFEIHEDGTPKNPMNYL